jgi:hypothetical protein
MLKMDAACSSGTSLYFYKTTWCHNREGHSLNSQLLGILTAYLRFRYSQSLQSYQKIIHICNWTTKYRPYKCSHLVDIPVMSDDKNHANGPVSFYLHSRYFLKFSYSYFMFSNVVPPSDCDITSQTAPQQQDT